VFQRPLVGDRRRWERGRARREAALAESVVITTRNVSRGRRGARLTD
jgi:hypothetical protein